jgi:hypothetical protein
MQRFLRETWELGYWAMFCPSKLHQRMNEWTVTEEKQGRSTNISSCDILLFYANYRFIKQYLLLVFVYSLPLAIVIFAYGQSLKDWLLLPVVLLTSYAVGISYVPLGVQSPLLLWGIVILSLSWDSGTELPEFLMLLASWLIGISLSPILPGKEKLRIDNLYLFLGIPFLGGIIVYTALLIIINPLIIIGYLRIFSGYLRLSLLSFRFSLFQAPFYSDFYRLRFLIIGITFLLGYFSVISKFLATVLIVVGCLTLGWYSIVGSNFFIQFSWHLVLAFFIGYIRVLPGYLVLILPVLLWASTFSIRLDSSSWQILRRLPPYTNELVWLPLPLPGHDDILVAAFRSNAQEALDVLHVMQSSEIPALVCTVQKALPQIITDQLAAVDNIEQLVSTAKPQHSILPLLVPLMYPDQEELLLLEEKLRLQIESKFPQLQPQVDALQKKVHEALYTGVPLSKTEITIFLRLKSTALDVAATLKLMSADLQARSLDRILNHIEVLQIELPKLGLKAQEIKRWQSVLQRWKRVVQIELEQQQAQSQGELPNPFQYGNPLRPDRSYLFKGRTAFADQIVRLVIDRNRPTLVLHGPRRCGKSSFLVNLPRLLPSDMLPIYLDMQSAAVTTDEASFCQGIVRAISKDSRSQGVELPAIPQRKEFLDTPYIALEDWLEQAVPTLGDRRLLLNLDEFEKIGSAINEGRMSLNLFNELRHLIQHYDQLGFLFSGVQTLDELGPNWSSYFISVVPIEMLYLEPDEAQDLLLNPDPEFTLRYDTGIVEEILTLTRCHPYLLQLIGWSLVKLANERHTQLVTSDLLQAAIPEAFTNGQPYFTNVWTEFTGTSPAEVKAGQNLLLALAQGNQRSSVAGDETVQAARRRLLRYHVLEETESGDRFEVPLLEQWVRERAVRN